jgi:hypothetical protein
MTGAKPNAMEHERAPLLFCALTCCALACSSSPHAIHEQADLPQLAVDLKEELRQHNIKAECSAAGLRKVEAFLETMPEADQQDHMNPVAAYLGECMIGTYGGEWVEDSPGVWAVKFPEGNMAFPFVSVQQYVDDPDAGDSFAAVFDALPTVFGWVEKEEAPRDVP